LKRDIELQQSRRLRSALATALCILLASPAGAIAARAKTLPGFHSPSGNIRCLLVTDKPQFLLCDIRKAGYSAQLVHHCGSAPYFVDWAGFSFGATRKAGVVCAGGMAYDPSTEHPQYVNLPYGATWHRGSFDCRSETTGVTCTNGGGHTLFVSSQSWHAS
jgi:hypothetical protein